MKNGNERPCWEKADVQIIGRPEVQGSSINVIPTAIRAMIAAAIGIGVCLLMSLLKNCIALLFGLLNRFFFCFKYARKSQRTNNINIKNKIFTVVDISGIILIYPKILINAERKNP